MGGDDRHSRANGSEDGLLSIVTTLSLFHDLVQLETRDLSERELLQRAAESVLAVPSVEVCVIHKQRDDSLKPGVWAGWRDLLMPDVAVADDGLDRRLVGLTDEYARVAARESRVIHLPDLGLSEGSAETRRDLATISAIGVDFVQGNLLGRPKPLEEWGRSD